MFRITKKRVLALAGGIALVAALLTLATTLGPLAAVRVNIAAAQRGSLDAAVFGIGTVEARFAYAVGPTQAGRVAKVYVDHGAAVQAGQALAELDPVDLGERLAASGAALERARASVLAAQAQAREAASRHQLALANAERYQQLAQKNFVSKEAVEIRRTEAAMTAAGTEAARASLAVAQREVGRLERERAAAAAQLANLKLIAPVDGVVVERLAEPGTTVVAGQAVVRLIDPSSVWVRARIDQARAGGISVGDAAEIVLRSARGSIRAGHVARVEIQSDTVTEERIVNVAFAQRPATLSIGELAEVTIRRPAVENALYVPSAAVKAVGGQRGVWRVADGRARFHSVQIGLQTLDGRTQILEGLSEGDEVIVHSGARLEERMRVSVVEKP